MKKPLPAPNVAITKALPFCYFRTLINNRICTKLFVKPVKFVCLERKTFIVNEKMLVTQI